MQEREKEIGEGNSPRRRFLKWLTGLFLSFWGLASLGAIVSYLKSPEPARSEGLNTVNAGLASTLSPGDARLIRHGSEPIYVTRLSNGELVAMSALCTHFRCVLKWDASARNLVCPCHNGVFNAAGEVIAGLPTRALRTYRVEVRREDVLVFL